MPDHDSDGSSPPPDYEMTRPCEEILQSFAAGHLTAASAAPKLAALTIPDPNIDPEEIEEHLRELWQILLVYLARNAGTVKIIADLIWCIARLPPALIGSGEQLAVDDGCQRVWQDVPSLGRELREEWNFSLSDIKDPSKHSAATEKFVAVNALVATLMTYDEELFDYRNFILWTFRSALEYTASMPECDDAEKEWEGHVLAAAAIAEIAGAKVRDWDFEFESGPYIGDPGAGGALWDGKHGFCKGRWELWQRRFFEVSADTTEVLLSDEAQEKARMAGEIMVKLSA